MNIKHIVFALLLGAAANTAFAQQVPNAAAARGPDPATLSESQIAQVPSPGALFHLASVYKEKGDLQRLAWTLVRLVALRPETGDLKLALATTYALQGEMARTYDTLLAMQKQGYGYDLTNDKNFAKVAGTKVWTYVVDGLKSNLNPFGEGKIAFTLPKGDTLFESIVFDPKREQFLVGSVREGKIYRVGKDGALQDFIAPSAENGLWSVYAMAADPERDALYVASTASVYFKGFATADYGKAGVFKFSLSSGKLLEKYLLAPDSQPRTLSSIAVGKNGQVFVADGLRNLIYRVDGNALKMMVENPHLTSVRGMAVSGDGKILYFADYALGVFGVDLVAGKGFDFSYDRDKLVLGGIDGMAWYDNTLVVIENGMSPHRVMRLTLDATGHKILKAIPLEVARPELSLPTYGTIDGDGFYFIANSQKNAYGTYGTPRDDAKLAAVNVFRSNLRFAWNEEGIPTQHSMLPAQPVPLSSSKPGSGKFGNVDGGSQSVTGN